MQWQAETDKNSRISPAAYCFQNKLLRFGVFIVILHPQYLFK
jgi:hypothetical protein